MANITTNVDLRNIELIIPEKTMRDIGLAYRKYRYGVVLSKRQLNDLSPMAPLKPETIRRKQGIHASATREKYGKLTNKASSVKFHRAGKVSRYPDVPLIDTGNMVAPNALDIEASDGHLALTQGTTRQEIASYHQTGGGKLPQRVHLSWNEEFVNTQMMPIIEAEIDRALRMAISPRTMGG